MNIIQCLTAGYVLVIGVAMGQLLAPQAANTQPTTPAIPRIACPLLQCPSPDIPVECQYVETYEFLGRKCQKCPVWRKGCVQSGPTGMQLNSNVISIMDKKSEIACPMIACDSYIPDECRVKNTYPFRGQICQKCPTWREGCREPERLQFLNSNDPLANPEVSPCPQFPCPRILIPEECKEEQPFRYHGKTCYRCPKWRPGCSAIKPIATISTQAPPPPPQIACPLFRCESLNVPQDCLQKVTFEIGGRICDKCPVVKPECQGSGLPPALNPCPVFPCPAIEIPAECKEEQPFDHNGQTCYRCPIWRTGCQPSTSNNFADLGNEPQIACPLMQCDLPDVPPACFEDVMVEFGGQMCHKCPKVKAECVALEPLKQTPKLIPEVLTPEIACPLLKCEMIYIPEECREIKTFQVQGRTCQKCPSFKDGCVPNTNGQNPLTKPFPQQPMDGNMIGCPLMACPLIAIPPNCVEEQPYTVQGRTCYRCPKWKKSCLSTDPVVPHDQSIINGGNEVACPMVACTKILTPAECKEEQPYTFQGKTCYKCPKWREGCVPGSGSRTNDIACPLLNCPEQNIPAECKEITEFKFQGKICTGCAKRKEGCVPTSTPLSDILEKIPTIACPLQDCSSNQVPRECEQAQPYTFQGQTCYKCPKWRAGCMPSEPTPVTNPNGPNVACPILNCAEVPQECIEETTYTFFGGKTCKSCPQWRMGCIPNSANSGSGSNTNMPVGTLSAFNGLLPVRTFMSMVNRDMCPQLRCSDIYIPLQCRDYTNYEYRGRTCRGCPTWRLGCRGGGLSDMNMNGILAYSLFNRMFVP